MESRMDVRGSSLQTVTTKRCPFTTIRCAMRAETSRLPERRAVRCGQLVAAAAASASSCTEEHASGKNCVLSFEQSMTKQARGQSVINPCHISPKKLSDVARKVHEFR